MIYVLYVYLLCSSPQYPSLRPFSLSVYVYLTRTHIHTTLSLSPLVSYHPYAVNISVYSIVKSILYTLDIVYTRYSSITIHFHTLSRTVFALGKARVHSIATLQSLWDLVWLFHDAAGSVDQLVSVCLLAIIRKFLNLDIHV